MQISQWLSRLESGTSRNDDRERDIEARLQLLVCIGLILLRRTAPDLARPFRTPWVPFVPIMGALICLAQMASLPWATWQRLFIWLALGFLIYFGYSRRSAAVMRAKRSERP